MLSNTRRLTSEVEAKTAFFRVWWAYLEEDRAETLTPSNNDFVYFLRKIRQKRRFMLKEEVERVVSIKNSTWVNAWVKLYDMTISSFRYKVKVNGKYIKDQRGKVRYYSTGELVQLFYSDRHEIRKGAYDSLFQEYGKNSTLITETYSNIARDWIDENVKLRCFSSPISARNIDNDLSDAAVERLLNACRRNTFIFKDYFRLKGKLMNMRRLKRYDIYAPISKSKRKVSFAEASAIVMEAFQMFDSSFAQLAKRVFDSKHIDVPPRIGKLSGAYCASINVGMVPYILLNFNGDAKDIYTIAHELGDAVHSQLASFHSQLTYHATLVLAETASVFGEMLLYDHLLNRIKDKEITEMTADRLSQIYSTVQRQAYISMFEISAYDAIDRGVTADELCRLYFDTLKEQFGDSLELPEAFRWEWSYIPHIFRTPFYCYAYAFGSLLALSMYKRYKEEGSRFVPGYLGVLSSGGSDSPANILAKVGVDIESEDFWEGGYRVVREMLKGISAT